MKSPRRCLLAPFLLCLSKAAAWAAGDASDMGAPPPFPRPLDRYHDGTLDVFAQIAHRATAEPFNLAATLLFLAAIAHTFLASKFMARAHHYEQVLGELEQIRARDWMRFRARMFHFLGEVEAIFGIWLIPLALVITAFYGWDAVVDYAQSTSFAEPLFVVAVMAIASSRPVLKVAEAWLGRFAAVGRRSTAAWWLSILTAGPLLGSLITEPAAMTLCALLLRQRFYDLKPGPALAYATLGLLFVNISVGGTLSHFAAPPIVMVAGKWNWGFAYMFMHFGWKAVIGIVVANGAHYAVFRKELRRLGPAPPPTAEDTRRIPASITATHLLFIAWTVVNSHHPPLVVLGFLFFLAFTEATESHQHDLQLRGPLLVGFFLAALILHGGCQGWWIAPVLGSLTKWPLMTGATLLTAVNDNAAITYLATLVPGFSEQLKFAVVAGAVAGGGLTVIANAPNPAGQSILQSSFGEEGISPAKLFLGALAPTLIMGAAFVFLP